MSKPAPDIRQHYTWSDYQTWDDRNRWQIVAGIAYLMSGPTSRHQHVVGELHRQMANHFKGKTCKLFVSPLDVVLTEEDVVQPDLLVVCDAKQIKRTRIEGVPALCVEIVSDSSAQMDRMLKLALYARAGVKEYWLITPWPSLVEVLFLQAGKYQVDRVFSKDDDLTSPTFPDLKLVLHDVFNFPLEPGEKPPVAKEPPAPRYAAQTR